MQNNWELSSCVLNKPVKLIDQFSYLGNIISSAENYAKKAGTARESIDCYHIYPTPPLGQDMTLGQFLSGV